MTVSYILFINFVPTITKRVDKKIVMIMGLLLSAIGDLVLAPIPLIPN